MRFRTCTEALCPHDDGDSHDGISLQEDVQRVQGRLGGLSCLTELMASLFSAA